MSVPPFWFSSMSMVEQWNRIARNASNRSRVDLLLAMLLGCTLASTATVSPAQDVPFSAVELVGTWSTSEPLPDGRIMALQFSLAHNRTFSGSATLEGKQFWTYSGSWQIKGTQVIWNYVNSSRLLPDGAKTDIDDIVSLEPDKLVLLSHLTGKKRELVRSR
jgi:hypothetical protein